MAERTPIYLFLSFSPPHSDLLPLNCLPSAFNDCVDHQLLKINTEARITFSITVLLKQNTLAGTVPHCAPCFIFILQELPCMFGLLEKHHRVSQEHNGNSSGAQNQGGLHLMLQQPSVATLTSNNCSDHLVVQRAK